MKGVLIGSDLMYRQDGKIVPIEINTNVGWDRNNRVEKEEDVFDFSDLKTYIAEHNITDVFLEGQISRIIKFWDAEEMGADVHKVSSAEFEAVEESENYLYIRSSYSDEAYVDNFCRDKINFLNAIKNRDYGCEFILRTNEGLEGEITHIEDNGDLPNFIIKYRYPKYNTAIYPMFVRFETLEQLNAWVEENLEEDYFMMPFYLNEGKGMWEDSRLKLIRNWSVFVADEEGTLDSIYIGQYTKVTAELTEEPIEWDEEGNPIDPQKVHQMFITKGWINPDSEDLLVEDDDVILMEDDSWKTARNLQVGDRVKTVTIPTEGDVDIHKNVEDYNISFDRLQEESTFTANEVKSKVRVENFIDETAIYFTDGTDWFDSDSSSYPVLDPEDGTVMFKRIADFEVGEKIILMPAGQAHLQTPEFVVREVESIEKRRILQKGFSISLDGNHLFLSKTSEDIDSYISIEHNPPPDSGDYLCRKVTKAEVERICSAHSTDPGYENLCYDWYNFNDTPEIGCNIAYLADFYPWDESKMMRMDVCCSDWDSSQETSCAFAPPGSGSEPQKTCDGAGCICST